MDTNAVLARAGLLVLLPELESGKPEPAAFHPALAAWLESVRCAYSFVTAEQVTAWTQLGTLVGVLAWGAKSAWDSAKAKHAAKLVSNHVRSVHELVNSNMITQMRINALQARRIANMTNLPEDEAAAIEAEKAYARQVLRQASLDASQLQSTTGLTNETK